MALCRQPTGDAQNQQLRLGSGVSILNNTVRIHPEVTINTKPIGSRELPVDRPLEPSKMTRLNQTRGRSERRHIAGVGAAIPVFMLASGLAAGAETGAPRIRAIRIECSGVFAGEERSSFVYRAADAIHVTTRSEFINRELLFAVGDSLDPALLRETERNLRKYSAIRSATIRTEPAGTNEVDVVVSTEDAWTTALGVTASRTGGRLRAGVSGQERNFLGAGKELGIAVRSGPDRRTWEFLYGDPHIFGSMVTFDVLDAENSDGYRRRVATARPFRSLDTPWAASTAYEQSKSDIRLYTGGIETAKFREHTQNIALEGGLRVSDPGAPRVVRLFSGYRLEDARYDQPPPTADSASSEFPVDRRFGYFLGRLEMERHNYIVEHNVNRLSRQEDFDLGTRFAVEFGASPRLFDADHALTGGLLLSRGIRLPRGFVLGSAWARSRYREGRGENALTSAQLTAVFMAHEKQEPGSHTLVAHALYGAGWNLDAVTQLAADGSTGLRGYLLHAFTGDRRLILNLEDRMVVTPEFWRLFQIGGVAFADAGYAWPHGDPMAIGDLRSDVGVGLRLGLTRSAVHDLWRIDSSYALRPDLLGRRGWLISFSSFQAF